MKVKKKTNSLTEAVEELKDLSSKEINEIEKQLEEITGIDDLDVVTDEDDISKALTRALKAVKKVKRRRREGKQQYNNVLLLGLPGVGKTAITESWCEKNDIHILKATISSMDYSELNGIPVPITIDDFDNKESNKSRQVIKKLPTTTFDELNDGKGCVLFLDEMDKGGVQVQGTLLTLINDHKLPDSNVEGGQRFIPNMLFTVAAVNHVEKLLPELKDRFGIYEVEADPLQVFKHFKEVFTNDIRSILADYDEAVKADDKQELEDLQEEAAETLGKLKIAKTLLTYPKLAFDSEEEATELNKKYPKSVSYNPRSLEKALNICDGTAKDFIEQWPHNCNPLKLNLVKDALAGYKDIDDKANSIFKKADDSAFDKLSSILQGS